MMERQNWNDALVALYVESPNRKRSKAAIRCSRIFVVILWMERMNEFQLFKILSFTLYLCTTKWYTHSIIFIVIVILRSNSSYFFPFRPFLWNTFPLRPALSAKKSDNANSHSTPNNSFIYHRTTDEEEGKKCDSLFCWWVSVCVCASFFSCYLICCWEMSSPKVFSHQRFVSH